MALRLPPDYVPYRELNLCSNVLLNVPVPLSVGDQPALLVGQSDGPYPLVWLAAPATPDGKEWEFVVERNMGLRPRPLMTVQLSGPGLIFPGHSISVIVASTIVIRVGRISKDAALVHALDLRPLGLVVHGDERKLHIGGMTMERNQFANLQVAFAIGTEEQRAGAS